VAGGAAHFVDVAKGRAARRATAALPPAPAPPPSSDVPKGAFAETALGLRALGLHVIPLDDKEPLISGFTTMAMPSADTVARWVDRFPGANIGIVGGRHSKLTLVDIDSFAAEVLLAAQKRFGDTLLKVRTPAGGWHQYFAWTDEGCCNLRSEGLPIDIKGEGGYVVAPPSLRRLGVHAGRRYKLVRGSWDDLSRLPTLKPGALPGRITAPTQPARLRPDAAVPPPLRRVREGTRNDTLFRRLLCEEPHCDTLADLIDVADTINADFEPPLPAPEATAVARKVWENYGQANRNWVGREGRAGITDAEITAIAPHSDAVVLLAKFRLRHWASPFFFASPKMMAQAQVVPGWAHQRCRTALTHLVDLGFLRIVHTGGRGPHDPRRYSLCNKGTETGPNNNNTPAAPLVPPGGRIGRRGVLVTRFLVTRFPSVVVKAASREVASGSQLLCIVTWMRIGVGATPSLLDASANVASSRNSGRSAWAAGPSVHAPFRPSTDATLNGSLGWRGIILR
jgi:hypothetical protein